MYQSALKDNETWEAIARRKIFLKAILLSDVTTVPPITELIDVVLARQGYKREFIDRRWCRIGVKCQIRMSVDLGLRKMVITQKLKNRQCR